MVPSPLQKLPPFFEKTSLVNIVIDTPKGAAVKLKLDESSAVFRVHKAMPLGLVFPFNFGSIPSTRGGDGDPLDALVLTEHGFPVGAVIVGKLIGVLEAVQTEGRGKERNDRLVCVPVEIASRKPMAPTVAFNSELKRAIEEFFVKYNELQNKMFQPKRYSGPSAALRLVRIGHDLFLSGTRS